ncbi:flagellar hook-length control protein FliK [Treponema zioleckii]|uniref:flagellar hook-length control protein FliK n=1 Tax=Treponema zioleckii TaxID=331680 RepID=UPI00168B0B61|nr:flagellar hook-length control protein FliK [Treponema zioleckii]
MNSIQQTYTEQILPQMQTQDISKNYKSGDLSFADALRVAQSESSNKNIENSSDKVCQKNENNNSDSVAKNASENNVAEKSGEQTEKVAEQSKKPADSDKVSKKDTDSKSKKLDDEKKNSLKKDLSADEIELSLSVIEKANVDAKIVNANNFENVDSENLMILADGEALNDDFELTPEKLSFLMQVDRGDSDDSELDEKLASLIKNLKDINDLNNNALSPEENLKNAQDLSVEAPEKFLEISENAIGANFIQNDLEAKLAGGTEKNLKAGANTEKVEKKSSAKLAVHDLRLNKLSESGLSQDKVVQKTASKNELKLAVQENADSNIQMTMELAGRAEQNITSSSSQAAAANGSTFQQMLSNAVQANAPEFVKAGNIILKDNNQGSINLVLRPESLGNVKISLSLSDKVISGQITVASREAYEAFRESIDSIKQAFAQNGFDTGNFDLNFSSQQNFAQGDGSQNQENQKFAHALNADRSYGELVASADSGESAQSSALSEYSVNIVA